MAVDDQLRLVQAQLAALVQQPLVHIHGDALGQKQIMRTQRNYLRDLALQIHGAFLHQHRADLGRRDSGQVHGSKLVHVAPALDAAPVDGADKALGGQVHDELAAFLN